MPTKKVWLNKIEYLHTMKNFGSLRRKGSHRHSSTLENQQKHLKNLLWEKKNTGDSTWYNFIWQIKHTHTHAMLVLFFITVRKQLKQTNFRNKRGLFSSGSRGSSAHIWRSFLADNVPRKCKVPQDKWQDERGLVSPGASIFALVNQSMFSHRGSTILTTSNPSHPRRPPLNIMVSLCPPQNSSHWGLHFNIRCLLEDTIYLFPNHSRYIC